ncbi:MAG: hypothetical protein WDW38_009288 [Sanguina aurantia]
MLNTGVVFVLGARWVSDRLYEAGAEDTILLPVRILGSDHALALTPVQGAQWAVAAVFALATAAGISKAVEDHTHISMYDLDQWIAELNAGKTPSLELSNIFQKVVGPATGDNSSSSSSSSSSLDPETLGPGGGVSGPSVFSEGFAAAFLRTRALTRRVTIHGVYIVTGGNLAASFTVEAVQSLTVLFLTQAARQRLAEDTKQ